MKLKILQLFGFSIYVFVLSECLEDHADVHDSQHHEIHLKETSRQLFPENAGGQIQRSRRSRPTRPSRMDGDIYPSKFNDIKLKRVSNEEGEEITSRFSFKFVIAADKNSSELPSCCKVQIEEGIRNTLHDIEGLYIDKNRYSQQMLMFTNIKECNSSPKYITLVTSISTLILENKNDYSTFSAQINNAIENGTLRVNIVRSGLSQQHDVVDLFIDGTRPYHLLCASDTEYPTLMPTAEPSHFPSSSPTKAPISLLFQVGIASGRDAKELSECCRERILAGAKESLSRIFSDLSGRKRTLLDDKQDTNAYNVKAEDSLNQNNTLQESTLHNISIINMVDLTDGLVDVDFDIQMKTIENSDDTSILLSLNNELRDEVTSGRFTESMKRQGLTDLEVTLSSNEPSTSPTLAPSIIPSYNPTSSPTFTPTTQPSSNPSTTPSVLPSSEPTLSPSSKPSFFPSNVPTAKPSNDPSTLPSSLPTSRPTTTPSVLPSSEPTLSPSFKPSFFPSDTPSTQPSNDPSKIPSKNPTFVSFEYVGCFRDAPDRALPYFVGKNMRSEDCQVACHEIGFKYSGLQFWGECRCGSSNYDKYGSSDTCQCDHENVGPYVNCVFERISNTGSNPPSSSPSCSQPIYVYVFVGCFRDTEDRALSYLVGKEMSVTECQIACSHIGFTYSGIQWLGECRCGDGDYDKYGQSDLCECNASNVGEYVNCVYEKTVSCS